MQDYKKNYFQRRTKPSGPRTNNRINSPEVQVISSDGDNLGIIKTNDAISRAKEEGLDLIEIAPNATHQCVKLWLCVSLSMINKKKLVRQKKIKIMLN